MAVQMAVNSVVASAVRLAGRWDGQKADYWELCSAARKAVPLAE